MDTTSLDTCVRQELVSRPNDLPPESWKVNCLIDFNGKAYGYTEKALKSLGSEESWETVTRFSLVRASIFPMEIRIRHLFKRYDGWSVAVLMSVPIKALISEPTIAHHVTNDPELRARIMPDNADFKCRDGVRIQLVLDMSNVWVRKFSTLSYIKPQIRGYVKDFIENIPSGPASMSIIMAPDLMCARRFFDLLVLEYNRHIDPMDVVWSKADSFFIGSAHPKQLNYKTINALHERPYHPDDPLIAFHNDTSRIVALQFSSYEEYEIESCFATKLREVSFDTVLVPDVTSKWSEFSSVSYGVTPDDTICTYLAVIRNMDEDHMPLLPDIGQPFVVTLDIEDPEPRFIELSEEDSAKHQLKVIRYLIKEATTLNQAYDAEVSHTSTAVQEVATARRNAEMGKRVASALPYPFQNSMLPNGLSEDYVKLCIALNYIPKFFPVQTDEELWEDDLVKTFSSLKLVMPTTSTSTAWPAVRTKPPINTPSQYVYLVIHTPRERHWPDNLVAPPMAFFPPCAELVGSLKHSLRNAEKTVKLRMDYRPNDMTMKMELEAVAAMAVAKAHSFKGAAWAYTARFDSGLETDLAQRFPQLEGFDMGAPYEQLQNAMSKCPSNLLVYSGCPGSGKTTFALNLVRCLVNDDDFKAVWTVHSNELCDDACDRLQKILKGTGKKVFRVYPIQCMLAALKGRLSVHDSNPLLRNQPWSFAATAVANHMRTLVAADDQEHPLIRADSLVVFAMMLAQKEEAKYAEFTTLRGRGSLSKVDEKTLTDTCYRLLSFALEQATVIVGTPVALGQIASATTLKRSSVGKWQPTAIFADDIGRMPEAQFWIPIAFFDAKFVVATGDPHQLKPMSKSLENHERRRHGIDWRSTFGPQRVMSLLRRMEKAGALASQIGINHRNIAGIANWARENIYLGKMKIEHGISHLSVLFRNEFNRILRAKSINNSFIIDIREGAELQFGTSYANKANRNYTFDLIFEMFASGFPSTLDISQQGTVMIITPYTAQLNEYINEWKTYKVNNAMRSRVFFRTVDNSMSFDADVVIFDTVRTDSLGFISDTQRMAVATTRARGAMVTLLNTSSWEMKWGLASSTFRYTQNNVVDYCNYHIARQAVVTTCFRKKGWSMICGVCGLPDHLEDECTSTLMCKKCNGVHAMRFCPHGFNAVDTYDPNRLRKQAVTANAPVIPTDVADPKVAWACLKLGIPRTRKQLFNNEIPEQAPEPQTEDALDYYIKYHQALHALDPSHVVPNTARGVVSKAKVLGEEDADDQSEIEQLDIVEAEGKAKGVDYTFDDDGGKW